MNQNGYTSLIPTDGGKFSLSPLFLISPIAAVPSLVSISTAIQPTDDGGRQSDRQGLGVQLIRTDDNGASPGAAAGPRWWWRRRRQKES